MPMPSSRRSFNSDFMAAFYTHYLIDLDNTLLDFDLSSKEAFAETVEKLGMSYTERMFFQYAEINYRCWKLLEKGQINPEEVQRRRFADFLKYYHLNADPMQVNETYLHHLSQKVYWEKGARELLETLKERGASLTLITNGLKSVQRPRLKRSGLETYFDLIVISEEIGHAKPQLAYFEYTLRALNNPPTANVLVIGDNAGSDVLGGQRAGLDTCWYNKHGKQQPEGIDRATYEVKSIKEVLYIAP